MLKALEMLYLRQVPARHTFIGEESEFGCPLPFEEHPNPYQWHQELTIGSHPSYVLVRFNLEYTYRNFRALVLANGQLSLAK